MKPLKQLLDHYCPEGVEYVRLGDVATVGTGRCDRKNATADGEFPFFVRSQQILRYPTYQFDEEAIIVPGEGAIGEIFHYIDGKYALHQRAYRVHFTKDDVNTKFALYVFKSTFKNYVMSRAVTATVSSLRKPMFTEFPIPLPPREVQDKIVEILDTFAALCGNLDTDIAQREKQFAGYREKLLTCPDSTAAALKLGDFLHMRAGKHIKAAEISSEPNNDRCTPCIGGNGLRGYVNRVTHNGDFPVVGRQGALCGNVRWVSGDFYATEHAIVVTPDESVTVPRYSYHLLTLMNLNQYASKSAQPGLAVSALKRLSAELPCLETQQEIADKLDAMQELIDNLRLERKQRQQQFDYYRERLLSFSKKNTAEV